MPRVAIDMLSAFGLLTLVAALQISCATSTELGPDPDSSQSLTDSNEDGHIDLDTYREVDSSDLVLDVVDDSANDPTEELASDTGLSTTEDLVCLDQEHRDPEAGRCALCIDNSHCSGLACVASTCRPCIGDNECDGLYCSREGQCQFEREDCVDEGEQRCSNHHIDTCRDGFWQADESECPFGCDSGTGTCYPETNVGAIGGRCEEVTQCDLLPGSTLCLYPDEGFLEGQCSQPCTGNCLQSVGEGFTASICADSEGLNSAGICVSECDEDVFTDTGCRPGYECVIRNPYGRPDEFGRMCLPINWWRRPTHAFTFGVAAGDIQPTSAVVWAHAGDAASEVVVQYGEDPDRLDRRLEAGQVTEATGFTLRAELLGLSPDTQYYYRFELDRGLVSSSLGSFTTAPRPEHSIPVRFLVSADVPFRDVESSTSLTQDPFDVFSLMAGEEADFFLSLGDWPNAHAATEFLEYHDAHKVTRGRQQIVDFLRDTPVYAIFDDREILNDWDATAWLDSSSEVRTGLAVWSDWFPWSEQVPGEYYRRFRWGDLEFFILDTRTHRSSRTDFDGESKTMLGPEQLEWLLHGLTDSTAVFKLVVSSVPFDFSTNPTDAWTGYTTERDLIWNRVICPATTDEGCEPPVPGVVFLSAGQHWFAANHHSNGMKEFQLGPLTMDPGAPPLDEMTAAMIPAFNYGVFEYDPADLSLRIETWDIQNAGDRLERSVRIYSETIAPEVGRIEVSTTDGLPADFRICLPGDSIDCGAEEPSPCAHVFSGTAPAAFDYAMVGAYRIHWLEVGGYNRPAAMDGCLEPGGTLQLHGEFSPVALPWSDDFSEQTTWHIVDEGYRYDPSEWAWREGELRQTSNILDDPDEEALPMLGTLIWTGNTSWDDYRFSVRFRTSDDDGVGVLARYQDAEHYYRFSLNSQHSFARLVKRDGDTWTALAVDDEYFGYPNAEWQTISVRVTGDLIEAMIGETVILSATDASFAQGAIGLYSWGSDSVAFDDVLVE